MITTKIPELNNVTLYEAIKLDGFNGFDICDRDWDWGIYVVCEENWEDCKDSDGKEDWYDKFMLLFCMNVMCDKINKEGYSPCGVAKFIWDNKAAIDRFLNEENKEQFTPAYWISKGEKLDPEEDGLFFDVYMESFESLLEGNYCDSDYKKLFEYLTEVEKEEK